MRRLLAALLATVALGASSARAAGLASPEVLSSRLESSWRSHDPAAYLALWRAAPAEEQDFAHLAFAPDREGRVLVQRLPGADTTPDRARVAVQTFLITEPRASLETWLFTLERGADGWSITGRDAAGRFDVVHLGLDRDGLRADGLSLSLEDFTLDMQHGTLFTSPAALGPTVLVFVGDGTVRFHPRPPTEQEQLRQFSGARELDEKVHAAFIRLHPADLHRLLGGLPTAHDPASESRFEAASRVYREQVGGSFVLDADLPRSPWWVLPQPGDTLVTFETDRRLLTFTISSGEAEGISLFDRGSHRQVCLYPALGKPLRWSDEDRRGADVVGHDLRVKVDPERRAIEGQDTVRMNVRAATGVVQLRLANSLQVQSVTSREGGVHPFFRVRHQDRLFVALGPLAYSVGEIALTVKWSGTLTPTQSDREAQTAAPVETPPWRDIQPQQSAMVMQQVLTYTSSDAWYPQAGQDDYATARVHVELPEGWTAVTGGTRVLERTEGEHSVVEYDQDRPAKYITLAMGRLVRAGTRTVDGVGLEVMAVPRLRGQGEETLALSEDILRFLTSEYGPCPYAALRIVLSENTTPGGHSAPGTVLLTTRPPLMPGELRDDPARLTSVPGFFLAHEIAHQWWGHAVAGENYHERWVSEGFAQYAAATWVRHHYGDDEFQSMLRRMAAWSVKAADRGPIRLGQRLGQLKGDPQAYRAIVYDKGAYVLHMLREMVGNDAFLSAMRHLQQDHRFAYVGTDDVRTALETASGRPLLAYFDHWVSGTAVPRLQVTEHRARGGSGYTTVIGVRAVDLPGPVPLEITVQHDGGKERKRVVLPPGGGEFTVTTSGVPRKVEVNHGRDLLAIVDKS